MSVDPDPIPEILKSCDLETAILAGSTLAIDWLREEEEKAWAHLQERK